MANPQEKHPGLSVPFYLTVKTGTPQALLGLSPGGSMVWGLRHMPPAPLHPLMGGGPAPCGQWAMSQHSLSGFRVD